MAADKDPDADQTPIQEDPTYVRTYNKQPVGFQGRTTKYDGKMFRDVRFTEIPGWLISNVGYNGFVRADMFMHRKMTNKFGKGSFSYVYAFLGGIVLTGMYIRHFDYGRKSDLVIQQKYGGEEGLNEMHPMDRRYTRNRVWREVTKPHFV